MVMLPKPISTEHKEIDGKFIDVEQYVDGAYGEKDVQSGNVKIYYPDGKTQEYVISDNGEYWLREEKLADGKERVWYPNGKLKAEVSPVDGIKLYYDNGQQAIKTSMREMKGLSELRRELAEIGLTNIDVEKFAKRVVLKIPYKRWYKNGNTMEEGVLSGREYSIFKYSENGALLSEHHSDKIGYKYSANGKEIILPLKLKGKPIKMEILQLRSKI